MRTRFVKRWTALAGSLFVIAICCAAAQAQSNYSDKDFGTRMASAFVKFTEVSSLGGETVANRYSSAINPATVGWYPLPDKLGMLLSPYYSNIKFGNGSDLNLIGESATYDTKTWGAFQPTLGQIVSNSATGKDGLSFDYNVDVAQMQWGKRLGDLGLGACFNYAHAEIGRKGTVMERLFGQNVPTDVDTHDGADSYRWRFGSLYQPVDKLLLGCIFEYGFQDYRSHTTVTPIPAPAFSQYLRDDGTQQQFIVRPGISYEYLPMSTVYFDYQYGDYFNTESILKSHEFVAGVDHRLLDWLWVRAGRPWTSAATPA